MVAISGLCRVGYLSAAGVCWPRMWWFLIWTRETHLTVSLLADVCKKEIIRGIGWHLLTAFTAAGGAFGEGMGGHTWSYEEVRQWVGRVD